MGYSQGKTNHHNGVEGWGYFLNKGAREIHWLEQLQDICGGPSITPQEEYGHHKVAWV